MTNVLEVLTNPTTLYAFPHTILGALSTGGMVILAVCAYHLLRKREVDLFRRSASMALPIVLAAVAHGGASLLTHSPWLHLAIALPLFTALLLSTCTVRPSELRALLERRNEDTSEHEPL